MISNRTRVAGRLTLVFLFVLTATMSALAQNQAQTVPDGKKLKIQGIVIARDGDMFRVQDLNDVETVAVLTSSTKVKTHRNGLFRWGKDYPATSIQRGLRLQVEGVGNADGVLVANLVKFDERDLRTAQALKRVQQQADANTALGQANAELGKANRERIVKSEANQVRMSGQIAENTALANNAQSTADTAVKSSTVANKRISELDVYDPVRTFTVYFRTGSAVLSRTAKREIDDGAEWVKTQNTKGWVVAVVGFADTTGDTAGNRRLSDRRADVVLDYLLTKHNLTLQRLEQPFGYGESNPVAENSTSEGRAKNRRVEIRLLVNRGIAAASN